MKLDHNIARIIKQYGTPCYVFFEKDINNQVQEIKRITGDDLNICYAIKANPFIVPMVDQYVYRFEACSWGEYQVLIEDGIEQSKIVFSGVNKSYEEIEELFDGGFSGVCTIESKTQLSYIKSVCEKKQLKCKAFVRVSSGNQFGVSKDDFLSIIKESNASNSIDVIGLHFFSGTQKKDVEQIKAEVKLLKDLSNSICDELGVRIREIEYGPGLFVDYYNTNDNTEYLKYALNSIRHELNDFNVTLELGRYLAYKCGRYYTSVVDVKSINGKQYVIVDGGIHQVNYYGQLLGIKVPNIKQYGKGDNNCSEIESIVCGSLCTANDILIKKWRGEVCLHDIFEFNDAGAYSCFEGGLLFLSRKLPAVIAVDNEGDYLLRDHEPTYQLNKGRYSNG